MPTPGHTSQRCLVAFATGWGSELGGINVFNTALLTALSVAYKGQLPVVCFVSGASAEQVNQAWADRVRLFPLPYAPATRHLDESHARAAIEILKENGLLSAPDELVWLGHDRITGAAAVGARDLAGGRAAVVHHMSYADYETFAESAASASAKFDAQRRIFERADVLLAVGPLLRDALRDMVRDKPVTMLVPGLDEISPVAAPNRFIVFMSGRISADTARIKQGHLGVAAFADAHKRASQSPGLPESLKDQPRMILRGVSLEAESAGAAEPDAMEWVRFAQTYAGRVVTIQALSYTTQRKALLDELSRATVALMPSWHEGFGLAGWEAIAAGVPLVVSEKSGVHKLLEEESNGAWLGWVFPVDVHGQVDEPYFLDEDVGRLSDLLLEIARDPAAARVKAARLREAVLSQFTWKHCVDSVLATLGWEVLAVDVTAPQPAESPPPAPAPPEAPDEASPLEVPRPRWRPGSGLADSQLLRAEEAAVPFDAARAPELEALLGWAADAEYPQALRLITGSGGTGKTRLALELCGRLNQLGWHCGLLPSDARVAQIPAVVRVLMARGEPVLVVIDYAETRQDVVIAFVKAMIQATHASDGPAVRILLLARDGGEWWDRLPARDSSCEPFLCGYATSGPFTLLPMHNGVDARERAYRAAVRSYAGRMGLEEVPALGLDLTGDHFGRPLYIQMAALLALHGERPASAEGLTKALLHHERRYWARLLRDASNSDGLSGVDDRHAAELMALATLAGGFARPVDAQQAWKRWSSSLGGELDAARQREIFERLAPLYPGQRGLQPLRPDLLGEALIAHAFLQPSGDDLLDALLGPRTHSSERQSALTVVARLSNHRPDIESTVVQSLSRRFVSTMGDIVNVGTQSDSDLPDWAERAFSLLSPPVRNQAVGLLSPMLENESVRLASLACAVRNAEVEKYRQGLSRKPNDRKLQTEYAYALDRYAISLGWAGKEPLPYSRESVAIFERLARYTDEHMEASAFALNNYAGHLSESGQHTEALLNQRKALDVYEKLILKKPGWYEDGWARSLRNYALSLTDHGRCSEAVAAARKSVEIRERLHAKHPEGEADWASALGVYAATLGSSGLYTEALALARQALDIHEKLAAANPDRFEPRWAESLTGYATFLHKSGRYSEAVAFIRMSVDIYQKLVAKNRERFEPKWAASLGLIATILADIGKYDSALEYQVIATEIYHRLASRQPVRFAEPFFIAAINGYWFTWLAGAAAPDAMELPPPPNPSWCRPRREPVLRIYRAWVHGCGAGTDELRATAFGEVLSARVGIDEASFREAEPYWLCAYAWCAKHAPAIAPEAGWNRDWSTAFERFIEEGGGNRPAWMDEVARRLRFEWP